LNLLKSGRPEYLPIADLLVIEYKFCTDERKTDWAGHYLFTGIEVFPSALFAEKPLSLGPLPNTEPEEL
jgi:hypothetical protein